MTRTFYRVKYRGIHVRYDRAEYDWEDWKKVSAANERKSELDSGGFTHVRIFKVTETETEVKAPHRHAGEGVCIHCEQWSCRCTCVGGPTLAKRKTEMKARRK